MFVKFSQVPQEDTCVEISFWLSYRPTSIPLYWNKTPTQVFFCELCEIFKNTYFEEYLPKNDVLRVIDLGTSNVDFEQVNICWEYYANKNITWFTRNFYLPFFQIPFTELKITLTMLTLLTSFLNFSVELVWFDLICLFTVGIYILPS